MPARRTAGGVHGSKVIFFLHSVSLLIFRDCGGASDHVKLALKIYNTHFRRLGIVVHPVREIKL